MATNTLQEHLDQLPKNDSWGVKAANKVLSFATEIRCSDLHLTWQSGRVVIRARVDGTLEDLAHIDSEFESLLLARLKVMARLPAYVKKEPQDGRIDWELGDQKWMLRVSFLPTVQGESVLIRFPQSEEHQFDFEALGLDSDIAEQMDWLITRREGVVFFTGPSGSGKTTTIYALMDRLNTTKSDRLHFLTIEDPVERRLPFADQVQVNEAQNMTFDAGLRAILRQDPDVIMIGEIRDRQTAVIAMQAGMTGHLVFSTLHAGRASSVFSRLMSMEIEPYIIASSMSGAVGQRLARKLCPSCREPNPNGAGFLPNGCGDCSYLGHKGRTGIYEIVSVNETLRGLLLSQSAPSIIAKEVKRAHARDLLSDGMRLVEQGVISLSEYHFLFSAEIMEEKSHISTEGTVIK